MTSDAGPARDSLTRANLKTPRARRYCWNARIINYPSGGDVGLFVTWPKSSLEA